MSKTEIRLSQNGTQKSRDEFKPKFGAHGLLPVVVQDLLKRDVLMLAYMNEEAFELSLNSSYVSFWSRSRNKIWVKGEESGNKMRIIEAHLDCDADSLLVLVELEGDKVACHTGKRNCFTAQAGSSIGAVLDSLEETIELRRGANPESSYTALLLSDENLALKKVGEEATEVVMAAKDGKREPLSYEAADLMYHLLVVCKRAGLELEDLAAELKRRFK